MEYNGTKSTHEVTYLSFHRNITLTTLWLSELDYIEREIVIQRCFQKKSIQQISINLNYKNHSSISRIYTNTLKKLSQKNWDI